MTFTIASSDQIHREQVGIPSRQNGGAEKKSKLGLAAMRKLALLAVCFGSCASSTTAFAETLTLWCRGGGEMFARYYGSGHFMTVYLNKAKKGTNHGPLGPGECAMLDRPIGEKHPSWLRFDLERSESITFSFGPGMTSRNRLPNSLSKNGPQYPVAMILESKGEPLKSIVNAVGSQSSMFSLLVSHDQGAASFHVEQFRSQPAVKAVGLSASMLGAPLLKATSAPERRRVNDRPPRKRVVRTKKPTSKPSKIRSVQACSDIGHKDPNDKTPYSCIGEGGGSKNGFLNGDPEILVRFRGLTPGTHTLRKRYFKRQGNKKLVAIKEDTFSFTNQQKSWALYFPSDVKIGSDCNPCKLVVDLDNKSRGVVSFGYSFD